MKLEVGQRIEVYKVLINSLLNDEIAFGSYWPVCKTPTDIDRKGDYIYIDNDLIMGITEKSAFGIECRPVGAMIIKSVK